MFNSERPLVHNTQNTKYRILVVDDEQSVARSIKMLLEHDGHEVLTVDSGPQALSVFEPEKFDLVITDHSMPDMKGSQLVEIIKQRCPDQRILMITAFANDFCNDVLSSLKPDMILDKPFTIVDLRQALARILTSI